MTMFTIHDTEFGWEEIVIAAEVWGEWQPFVEQTRQSLCCLRLATDTDQLPAESETRAAATSFRYAHNLISAEETLNWLNARGLTVEDWMDYLRARLLRERWEHRLDEITESAPTSDEESDEAVKIHAICADKLIEWARKLAGRAAVVAGSGSFGSIGLTPREMIERIEAGFASACRANVTPDLLEAKITDRLLDWIRFDCRYIWFPEERIAREASCCVTEDGWTIQEIARESHSIVQEWNFYLDEIEPNLRHRFLAAQEGEWLGPIKILEGFPVFSIVNKQMPSPGDAGIRRRAAQAIVNNLIENAINQHVRWVM
jgi:hypothetical protein